MVSGTVGRLGRERQSSAGQLRRLGRPPIVPANAEGTPVRHGPAVLIGLIVQLAAAPGLADRATDLAAQASSAQRRTCQNVTGLNDCHPAYPTGCSHSANPQYDAYLNLLKNQTPAPSTGISRYITQTAIQSL